MKQLKEHLDLALAFAGLLAMAYRLGKLEAKIYLDIDALKDDLTKQIESNKHKIELHLVEWEEKKENYNYRFNGIEQLVKHKFERLANWVAQIGNFLAKESGFNIRDDKY